MACKSKLDTCGLNDDLTRVLESMRTADIIVAATPVYSGYASGQFKCFMDRCYSFLVPDFMTNPVMSRMPPGKKVLVITTQGHPDPSLFGDFIDRLETWVKRNWRAGEVRVIRGCGFAGDPNIQPFLKQAEELAASMCG
jgi:multimeric flavodoxin WrbA